jgi:ribonuclease P protein component
VPAKTVVVYSCKTRYEPRFAVVAGKKVGNAVLRNRAKRVLRAAFWEIMKENSLKPKHDFILVARVKTPLVKMEEVKKDVLMALKKLEMI